MRGPVLRRAIELGGRIKAGLELFYDPARNPTNLELVQQAQEIVRDVGRPVATQDEARALYNVGRLAANGGVGAALAVARDARGPVGGRKVPAPGAARNQDRAARLGHASGELAGAGQTGYGGRFRRERRDRCQRFTTTRSLVERCRARADGARTFVVRFRPKGRP